jgi:hypothetical protein
MEIYPAGDARQNRQPDQKSLLRSAEDPHEEKGQKKILNPDFIS